ncbi:PLP-dependent aminotransferase family protein [Sphingobacterium sp. SRCM116780]|uniref:aminotransferase-like domain-containing protein n=1 Tax=Sphingobacterium sp. SRCM116780 TaxID=2907623 RepID=UPI001F31BDFF|nr:PLP-dependent aminotransferase family protein [Sphingobacterium sp. SRCM116780]UIR54920.1 PLP-dependent aminotransferase family protein [Sphingobacterium sp. SRCM116780]
MLPYKNLFIIDKNSPIAIFKQIATQFIRLIQEGKLLPGTALPSTRTLAFDLELHRKTIVAAYELLVSEDWVVSLLRKGFIVSPHLPIVKPRSYHSNRMAAYEADPGFQYKKLTDIIYPSSSSKKTDIVIDDGLPDIALLPTEAMFRQYKRTLDYPSLKRMSLGWDLEGTTNFKNALCGFLNQTRGIDIRTENLLTTRGAQMAIYVAASLIIQPGDKVIVSEPSYMFANMIFENFGAELIRVPVDDHGMCTHMVEELLIKHDIKLLYVIPHHHHPTTVTMSVERRNHLLKLIRDNKLAVIEDDYDYDCQFQYDPYLPLASGNHEGNIIYIGSLTKVLGTPFRLGYLIAAERFIHAAAKKRLLIDLRGDVFTEQVVSGLIESGDLTRLIQKANRLYRQRCHFLADLLTSQLGEVTEFKRPNGGMAVWLRFHPNVQLTKIIEKTSSKGLKISGSVYNQGSHAQYNAFRFGFASLHEEQLEKAVDILRTSINKLK